jgi:hypothetical protein
VIPPTKTRNNKERNRLNPRIMPRYYDVLLVFLETSLIKKLGDPNSTIVKNNSVKENAKR